MSRLGELKAILVGAEPCQSAGAQVEGHIIYAVHLDYPAPFHGGEPVGYVSARGGIYAGGGIIGGEFANLGNPHPRYMGGRLAGYVRSNGPGKRDDPREAFTIVAGGGYETAYKGGSTAAVAGFDSSHGLRAYYKSGIGIWLGRSMVFSTQPVYVLDQYGRTVGWVGTDDPLVQAAAIALLAIFGSDHRAAYSVLEDKWQKKLWQGPFPDEQHLGWLQQLQRTRDALEYVRRVGWVDLTDRDRKDFATWDRTFDLPSPRKQ